MPGSPKKEYRNIALATMRDMYGWTFYKLGKAFGIKPASAESIYTNFKRRSATMVELSTGKR